MIEFVSPLCNVKCIVVDKMHEFHRVVSTPDDLVDDCHIQIEFAVYTHLMLAKLFDRLENASQMTGLSYPTDHSFRLWDGIKDHSFVALQ